MEPFCFELPSHFDDYRLDLVRGQEGHTRTETPGAYRTMTQEPRFKNQIRYPSMTWSETASYCTQTPVTTRPRDIYKGSSVIFNRRATTHYPPGVTISMTETLPTSN